MSEPDNHTLRLLKEIRKDIAGVHTRVDSLEKRLERRFDGLDKKLEDVKQAAFGESVLGRYAVAEVEQRLVSLEDIMASRRR
jgi:hypothetical protein